MANTRHSKSETTSSNTPRHSTREVGNERGTGAKGRTACLRKASPGFVTFAGPHCSMYVLHSCSRPTPTAQQQHGWPQSPTARDLIDDPWAYRWCQGCTKEELHTSKMPHWHRLHLQCSHSGHPGPPLSRHFQPILFYCCGSVSAM